MQLLPVLVCAQSLSFQRVHSGTKTDIRAVKTGLLDEQVYFLTDKIYAVKPNGIARVDMPVAESISHFYPFSDKEYWFSVHQNANNSILYHYKSGSITSVAQPLSNQIDLLHFYAPGKALLSGNRETFFLAGQRFFPFHPTQYNYYFVRAFLKDTGTICLLDNQGLLMRYQNGRLQTVLPGRPVTDFCFTTPNDGYILAVDELYRYSASKASLLIKDARLKAATRMAILKNGNCILIGNSGTLMEYHQDELISYNTHYTNDLESVVVTRNGEVWIGGTKGILLYSGGRKFLLYEENTFSFTARSLIPYAIPLDGEYGVAIADFNGDKKPDIYTVRIFEQNRFYINRYKTAKDARFAEEAVVRNALGHDNPLSVNTHGSLKLGIATADIDNDKDQDIYLCYLNSPNRLLINKGNGYFRNVSMQKYRASENLNRSNAAAFADVDLDGDLDLFVTSENGSNRLYENDGTGHFRDITVSSGLISENGGMCASFGDINQDGLPDLCVSYWYPGNKIYLNESKKGKIRFRNITAETDLAKAPPAKSNGVSFADVNNDGHLDLFIANRNMPNKLYINNGKGIFKDKTNEYFKEETFVSYGGCFADFDLDGFTDLYLTNVGGNVLYKNRGGKFFSDVTTEYDAGMLGYCTGCATGDMDGDGDPDLYVANYVNGNSQLFENNTDSKSFIKFNLQGIIANSDAIGAKIWLYKKMQGTETPMLTGYQEVSGGGGYASISDKEIIFGGDSTAEYFALIKFPSSTDTIRFDPISSGNAYRVMEMLGPKAFFVNQQNRLKIFFKSRENQREQIKFLFIALILLGYVLLVRKPRSVIPIRQMATAIIFSIAVTINLFFLFQWPALSYYIAPVVALSLLYIFHLILSRYLIRRFSVREKQSLREKLSRDLHDDLASTLGSISVYSQTLNNTSAGTLMNTPLLPAKIAQLSQSALHSVSDIIWMTSPKHDTLESLASKLHQMIYDLFTDNQIKCSSNIQIPESEKLLPEHLRNNVFLILKEGAHNIVKHAKATGVVFSVLTDRSYCTITLKDNGVGFDEKARDINSPLGNGLMNMKKRAAESGIEFAILAEPKKGTEITLKFKN